MMSIPRLSQPRHARLLWLMLATVVGLVGASVLAQEPAITGHLPLAASSSRENPSQPAGLVSTSLVELREIHRLRQEVEDLKKTLATERAAATAARRAWSRVATRSPAQASVPVDSANEPSATSEHHHQALSLIGGLLKRIAPELEIQKSIEGALADHAPTQALIMLLPLLRQRWDRARTIRVAPEQWLVDQRSVHVRSLQLGSSMAWGLSEDHHELFFRPANGRVQARPSAEERERLALALQIVKGSAPPQIVWLPLPVPAISTLASLENR